MVNFGKLTIEQALVSVRWALEQHYLHDSLGSSAASLQSLVFASNIEDCIRSTK